MHDLQEVVDDLLQLIIGLWAQLHLHQLVLASGIDNVADIDLQVQVLPDELAVEGQLIAVVCKDPVLVLRELVVQGGGCTVKRFSWCSGMPKKSSK